LRLEVLNEPKPGHATFSPLIAEATTSSKNAPIVFSASALETPAFSDTASMSSAFVIAYLAFSVSEYRFVIYLSRSADKLQALNGFASDF
jgi:hypothetical protein